MSKFLRIAPPLLLLSACSQPPAIKPMPLPPVNLEQNCPEIPEVPDPLIDPERLQWEADILLYYTVCAARHQALVEAWKGALK